MLPILDHPALLQAHAGPQILLAFDFDGTLAPIVDDPQDSCMRESTRTLLLRLAHQQPCIVISGRARADVLRLVDGIPLQEVIGNHGLESSGASLDSIKDKVREWRTTLAPVAHALAGVQIEDKTYSLTLHYRRSFQHSPTAEALRTAATQLAGARVVEGLYGINLIPDIAIHKGTALMAAHRRLGTRRMVFIGDEETDEDVFEMTDADLSLTVRVGQSPTSRARYYLRHQTEIEQFMQGLLLSGLATSPPAQVG